MKDIPSVRLPITPHKCWGSWSPRVRSVALHAFTVADRDGNILRSPGITPSAEELAAALDVPLEWADEAYEKLLRDGFLVVYEGGAQIARWSSMQRAGMSAAARMRKRRRKPPLVEQAKRKAGNGGFPRKTPQVSACEKALKKLPTSGRKKYNAKEIGRSVALVAGTKKERSQVVKEDPDRPKVMALFPDLAPAPDEPRWWSRAKEIYEEHERRRVALMKKKTATMPFSKKVFQRMRRLANEIRQVEGMDEHGAWDRVAQYADFAMSEVERAFSDRDPGAKKLLGWRRGPEAWRFTRYQAIAPQMELAAQANVREIAFDDAGNQFYIDRWGRKIFI